MKLPFEFLVLGRPASVNNYKSKKAWKDKVSAAANDAKSRHVLPHQMSQVFIGDMMAKVFWFPANNKIADVDNGVKSTLDAMSTVVYEDDKHIQRIAVQRLKSTPGTSIVVEGANASLLLLAVVYQTGLKTGVRQFATTVKIESYLEGGGAWW